MFFIAGKKKLNYQELDYKYRNRKEKYIPVEYKQSKTICDKIVSPPHLISHNL